jgi:alkanesulfonate monooxygenase SsuD/methylene tetrahydromethanopterin reductase-like flavin-dependent oxidoreductase (luciferase family)
MVEALGFDSFWVGDHPVLFPYDCWAHLAALAAATEQIRLGTLVTVAAYRHPVILARQVADVDRLSGGRLVLGLGIGDAPPEFAQLGLPYGRARDRQELLEELLQVLPSLLDKTPVTFDGQHLCLAEAQISPGPVQRPRVPILLAGGGERVTLRHVAQYADASNFGAGSLVGGAWGADDVRRKYGLLEGHCQALGRPLGGILRTHVSFALKLDELEPGRMERIYDDAFDFEFERLIGPPPEAVAYFRSLAQAGVQYFIVGVGEDAEMLRLLAERVIPELTGT